jgi:hypothetical protein
MQATAMEALQTRMPCCHATVPLTTLEFDWPAGFARFELRIWNPNVARDLDQGQLARLEAVLGCRLRQIRSHY